MLLLLLLLLGVPGVAGLVIIFIIVVIIVVDDVEEGRWEHEGRVAGIATAVLGDDQLPVFVHVGRDGAGEVGRVGQVVDVVVLAADVRRQAQRVVESLFADGATLRLFGVRVAVRHELASDGE